jgi:hypothetical protein
MGLIDEILHYITGLYRDEKNSQVMKQALDWLNEKFGNQQWMMPYANSQMNSRPSPSIAEIRLDVYLEEKQQEFPSRDRLEEMLMLWLAI